MRLRRKLGLSEEGFAVLQRLTLAEHAAVRSPDKEEKLREVSRLLDGYIAESSPAEPGTMRRTGERRREHDASVSGRHYRDDGSPGAVPVFERCVDRLGGPARHPRLAK
ncbi:hypothetical protein GCM10027018_02060 [Paenibacillus thermoaerophilus]